MTSPRLVPAVKRWIVLAHLYLGVFFSLLFVMWFASGIVLMYSPYPALTTEQKLHALPPLECARCTVTARAALDLVGIDTSAARLRSMRLGMLGDRPVWRIADQSHRVHAVYADTLASVPPLDSMTGATPAIRLARALNPQLPTSARAQYAGVQTEPDQWTLEQPIPAQLPMLRYDITDGDGTRLYVSSVGGEVVTGTTRRGRMLAWIGAVPHWIYPTLLRRHVREWSWLVILLAGLGTLMSVTGVAVGLWQWRWRTHRRGDGRVHARSPYRDVMMRWHHVAGLAFGAVTCTWIFSGMMSMNPGEWSPGTTPSDALVAAWTSASAETGLVDRAPSDAWRTANATGLGLRELRLTAVGAQAYWLASDAHGVGTLVRPDVVGAAVVQLPDTTVVSHAAQALGQAPLRDSVTMSAYDDYYRPTEGHAPPLPVLRVRFSDAPETWLYMEPGTGRIRESFTSRSRLERWLYTGLHDLDFSWLLSRGPLWDLVVLLLSIGGGLVSVTGLVVSWRLLRVWRGAPRAVRRR